ncbi:hypothetical protein BDV95DRAFT_393092 [Massariosphaeria phaeospora]|uniref:Uncharacterized protein n=1 Tax=Massariosphaeria phaeospora TaxID=100035 RepID=A0A7C8MBS7_9PLEO|nr:hypothetical protein BDV95DRAFT_393092 [Massariosphaeria phaeospora]
MIDLRNLDISNWQLVLSPHDVAATHDRSAAGRSSALAASKCHAPNSDVTVTITIAGGHLVSLVSGLWSLCHLPRSSPPPRPPARDIASPISSVVPDCTEPPNTATSQRPASAPAPRLRPHLIPRSQSRHPRPPPVRLAHGASPRSSAPRRTAPPVRRQANPSEGERRTPPSRNSPTPFAFASWPPSLATDRRLAPPRFLRAPRASRTPS